MTDLFKSACANRDALIETDKLLSDAQGILGEFLKPDGKYKSPCETINALLGLLDSPRQRIVKAATQKALSDFGGAE